MARALRRAESLAARARNVERTDPAAARDLYRQSLAIAADLAEALAGLKRTPPDPPTALDAQVLGDRIRLCWSPPPPDGLGPLTFVVVRKRGGSLNHPGDGTRIAEVSTNEFDDMHATPGRNRGLCDPEQVVAGSNPSRRSRLGPFVFLADVKDVVVELRDHEVELAWTLPRGVSEVRVIRKRGGPPTGPRDGERIATALDHAVDRNLENNEIFHYGIYAIYAMADGRLFPSPGVVVSARPQPPVSPLEAPRLLLEPGGTVRFDWIEPARGDGQDRAHGPVHCPSRSAAGSVRRRPRRSKGDWIEPAAAGRAYDPEPPADGHCYYTPLTVWAEHLDCRARGGPQPCGRSVRAPRDAFGNRSGHSASDRHGVTLALAMGPGLDGCAGRRQSRHRACRARTIPRQLSSTVDRAEYDRQDCWTLSLPHRPAVTVRPAHCANIESRSIDAGPWHIRVYSVIVQRRTPLDLTGSGAHGGHDACLAQIPKLQSLMC